MRTRLVGAVVALFLCAAPHTTTKAADEGCTVSGCHVDPKYALSHRTTIAERGRCLVCHEPHAPGQKSALKITEKVFCAKCHKKLPEAHAGYPIEEQRCSRCHVSHAPNSRKRLGSAVHEVASDCSSCHLQANGPTPFKLQKADPALCFDCHSDVEKRIKGKGAHPAVSDGTCTTCHSPHASWEQGMLLAPQAKLCAECHANVGEQAKVDGVHAPVKEGKCTACHRPPRVAQPEALPGRGAQDLRRLPHRGQRLVRPEERPRGGPQGACLSCHEPHVGKKHLLRKDVNGACLGCHAELKKRLDAPGAVVHASSPTTAATATVPHSSGEPSLLKRKAPELCLECHDAKDGGDRQDARRLRLPGVPTASAATIPHVGEEGAHARRAAHALRRQDVRLVPLPAGDAAGLRRAEAGRPEELHRLPRLLGVQQVAKPHDPVKKGECWKCHVPHAASRPHLLNDTSKALCTRCHDPLAGAAKEAHELARPGPTARAATWRTSRRRSGRRPPPPPAAAPVKKGPPAKGKGGKKK